MPGVNADRAGRWCLAAVAAVTTIPAAAHAAPYPVEPPPSTVSDGTVSDGGSVTFSGTGFLPFEKISINIGYSGSDNTAAYVGGDFVLAAARLTRLTVTADAHGSFSITVRLTEVGNATLAATGLTSGRTVSANVEVVAPSDGDNKPATPGHHNKPATPRDHHKPAVPGDHDKPAVPGDHDKPAAPGDHDKPAAPRDHDKPATPREGDGGHTAEPGAGTAMPRTGPSGAPVLIAAGLVSVGTVVVLLVRSRRRRPSADR